MSISKTAKKGGRTAPKRAIAGMAYVPVGTPEVGYGVVRRRLGDTTNDTRDFIWRKLHPVQRPASWDKSWSPTAMRWDILLPAAAPDDLAGPFTVTRAYEEAAWDEIKDLVICITLRLDPTRALHAQYEDVRAFAKSNLVEDRELPVILAIHDPAAAATDRPPHIHIMALARKLGRRFGTFAEPALCSDRGAAIIADEWTEWRETKSL
jgi:hypothetical protein